MTDWEIEGRGSAAVFSGKAFAFGALPCAMSEGCDVEFGAIGGQQQSGTG